MAYTAKMIKERHNVKFISGNNEDWDDTFYLNDPKSIANANDADLIGVFQYDSNGIREVVKASGIDSFDDLVAIVSLYRPGPLNAEMDKVFIRRKTKQEEYTLHPALAPILSSTYGIIVYQEQVMRILNVVGKIPLKDCETIRKAISKKKISSFIKYKEQFIENGIHVLGATREEVAQIFSEIESFAAYGFNCCLTSDNLLFDYTRNNYISVGQLFNESLENDVVLDSIDLQGNIVKDKLIDVFETGEKEVYEIDLDNGIKLKCTLDHKFLCEDYAFHTIKEILEKNLLILFEDFNNQH
jgi:DNA polymerase-3 subunit alpha